jgi:hypothetical protein
MVKEVRGAFNSDGNEARRGYSPGAYSSPSNGKVRADGGHIARHLGRGGYGPASQRRDSTPVVGGESPPRSNRQSSTWASRLGRDAMPVDVIAAFLVLRLRAKLVGPR